MDRRELDFERSAAPLPSDVEAGVDGQPVEPSTQLVRVPKPAQVLPCPKRRLLDSIARELRVAEDQSGRCVESREMPADKRAEGLMVTLACPLEESPLFHAVLPWPRAITAHTHTDLHRKPNGSRHRRLGFTLPFLWLACPPSRMAQTAE